MPAELQPQSRPAVIVMMDPPVPGETLMGLCPPLSQLQAAELAAHMAWDVVHAARQAFGQVFIAYSAVNLDSGDARKASTAARTVIKTVLFSLTAGVKWIAQRGATPGERMDCALQDASAQGYGPLVLVGAGDPTITTEQIREAVSLLDKSVDLSVGSTENDAIRFIAARKPIDGLLAGAARPTADDLCARAKSMGLRVECAESAGFELKSFLDLRRLKATYEESVPDKQRASSRTCGWIEMHAAVFDAKPSETLTAR